MSQIIYEEDGLTVDDLAILFFTNDSSENLSRSFSSRVAVQRPNESLIFTTKESYFWAIMVADCVVGSQIIDEDNFTKDIKKAVGSSNFRRFFSSQSLVEGNFGASVGGVFSRLRSDIFSNLSYRMKKFGTKSLYINSVFDDRRDKSSVDALFKNYYKRASRSYEKLVGKGLILDPVLEYLPFAVLGVIPYRFTLRTEAGQSKVADIEAAFWSYRRKKEEGRLDEVSFEVKLFAMTKIFKKAFVEAISEKYDPSSIAKSAVTIRDQGE